MIVRRSFAALIPIAGLVPIMFVLQAPAQQAHQSSQTADPKIQAALNEISAQQVQANIEKLVSFKTRITLSAQDVAQSRPDMESARRGSGSRASSSATHEIAADAWR